MNSLRRSVAILSLGLCLAVPVMAQSTMDELGSHRIISFGVGGGVVVPVSDAKDAFKNGFAGHGFVRLNVHQLPIAPRVDVTFQRFDLKGVSGLTTQPTGSQDVLAGLANVQLYLLHHGPIRPYAVAGVGAYHTSQDSSSVGGASVSKTNFGINGGAGVVFKLGSMVSGFIEGRVDNVYTSDKGAIQKDQIQLVPVTFGLVF